MKTDARTENQTSDLALRAVALLVKVSCESDFCWNVGNDHHDPTTCEKCQLEEVVRNFVERITCKSE